MTPSPKKNSALSRRLKQIEKELSLVSHDVKVMSKAVKRPGAGLPPAAQLRSQRRSDALVSPPTAAPGPATPKAGPGAASGELFHRIPTPSAGNSLPPVAATAPIREEQVFEKERAKFERDHRFASYFVSGSVDGIQPLRQERRVQRIKAIFMVVVLLIVLIFVLRLIL
jgi:hypothetical protein